MWTELVTHMPGWEELWTNFLSLLNGSCANSLMIRVPNALLCNLTPEFCLTHKLVVFIYQNCSENPVSAMCTGRDISGARLRTARQPVATEKRQLNADRREGEAQ